MGTPPDMPPGARNVVVDLPLPISEQQPPDLPPIPEPPAPDPGDVATIAT